MHSKNNIYLTADFETTTVNVENYRLPNGEINQKEYRQAVMNHVPQVYSWALDFRDDATGNHFIADGIELYTFVETLFNYIKDEKKDITVYFHNGAKFDLHFLVDFLREQGFKQLVIDSSDKTTEGSNFDWEAEYENITLEEKARKIKFGEYTMITNANHAIMEMRLASPTMTESRRDGYEPKARTITFRDTNLMFPSSLAGYGAALNKHFKTDEWSKLDLETGYTRETVYNDYMEFANDANEQEYLHMDVKILSEFLAMMHGVLPLHQWEMTAAGTAYKIWRERYYGEELLSWAVKNKSVKEVVVNQKTNFKKYSQKGDKQPISSTYMKYRLISERLPTEWMQDYMIDGFRSDYLNCHEAYQGGLTMANPKYVGKLVENVLYVDENSAYPGVMLQEYFPVGKAVVGDLIDEENMMVLYKLVVHDVENKTGLPFLYTYTGTSKVYPTNIKDEEYTITDAELERFLEYYEGDYEYWPIVGFKKVHGEKLFGSYIRTFYALKEQASKDGDEATKLYAKLMLNSLYGKFATNVYRESKIYVGEEGKLWDSYETVDDAKFYLPLGIWITAHARLRLVDGVGHRFDYCNYLDTDSLSIIVPKTVDITDDDAIAAHFREYYPNMRLHPTDIGDWDIEYKLEWQRTRRAKQYFMKPLGEDPAMKFAGLNMKKQNLNDITHEQFVFGLQGIKQLRPMRLPTGLVLEEYDKQIPPIWNYALNESNWFQNEKQFRKGWEKPVEVK